MSVNEESSAGFTSVLSRLDLFALLELLDIFQLKYKYTCRAASRLDDFQTELKITDSIYTIVTLYKYLIHNRDLYLVVHVCF